MSSFLNKYQVDLEIEVIKIKKFLNNLNFFINFF
jgi:hypothetical protein